MGEPAALGATLGIRQREAAAALVRRLAERPDLRVVESYQVDLGTFVEAGDAVYVPPDVMLRAQLLVAIAAYHPPTSEAP